MRHKLAGGEELGCLTPIPIFIETPLASRKSTRKSRCQNGYRSYGTNSKGMYWARLSLSMRGLSSCAVDDVQGVAVAIMDDLYFAGTKLA